MGESRGLALTTNPDTLFNVSKFVDDGQYLFFGPVSKAWRDSWGRRETATSYVTSYSTVPQLLRSFECGLPRDNVRLCSLIAGIGNLELLQSARENGCPWDETTCLKAASGGHLPVLRWAREAGCPAGGTELCAAAAGSGQLEVLLNTLYSIVACLFRLY